MLKLELAEISTSDEVDVALTGYSEEEVKVLLDGWTPDFKKVDDTEANLDGLQAKIVLSVGQENREEYIEELKEWISRKGYTDIVIR